MSRYIDADKAIEVLQNGIDNAGKLTEVSTILACQVAIDTIPTADVKPVIHGKWERVAGGSLIDYYRCTNCNCSPPIKQIPERKTWGWDFTDYCPKCGADMRGERK